jgi:hypothetical protein
MDELIIKDDCCTCVHEKTDKRKEPCSKCNLNELYNNHWRDRFE